MSWFLYVSELFSLVNVRAFTVSEAVEVGLQLAGGILGGVDRYCVYGPCQLYPLWSHRRVARALGSLGLGYDTFEMYASCEDPCGPFLSAILSHANWLAKGFKHQLYSNL